MKLKSILFSFFFLISIISLHAQESKLQGSWILTDIELNDLSESNADLNKEESFFGYYLEGEKLTITASNFPMYVGGDFINYEYSLQGSNLILSFQNTVMVLKDGKTEELTQEGRSDFKLKLSKKKLVISRRNQTFYESYTFTKAK